MKKFFGIMICLALICSSSLALSKSYHGKKVLYVDSYHQGYAWSDGITRGVKSTLEGTGVQLKIIRMDTKRNKDDGFKKQAALQAKAVIEEFRPDVVIASDDNASKFLIMPYFKDAKLPFVFCGVNWDAAVYGFPYKNVTGMVEVNDVVGLIKQLKQFARGDRVGFIAGDTLTNRKEVEYYKKIFNLDVTPYYANGFDDWKKGFTDIQNKVDVLIVYNYVAIIGWDRAEAEKFVLENTKIPTGTMQEGPMPYALIGFLKVAEEQGSWSAKTALKILDGAAPSSISITRNEQGELVLNIKLAKKMGIEVPYEMIESAASLIE
jgi:ABC-type uncharacterized transport system substrate-binding protein